MVSAGAIVRPPRRGGIRAVVLDYGGVIAEEGFRFGLEAIAARHDIDPAELQREAEDAIFKTVTDQFPSSGWLDSGGAENGDKCAWIRTGTVGAAADVSLTTGSFAVQSLWSNLMNSGAGGCAISYP